MAVRRIAGCFGIGDVTHRRASRRRRRLGHRCHAEDLGRGLAAGLDGAGGLGVAGGDALEGGDGGVRGTGGDRAGADLGEPLESLDRAGHLGGLGYLEELGKGEPQRSGALDEVGAGIEKGVEDGFGGLVRVHGPSVAGRTEK